MAMIWPVAHAGDAATVRLRWEAERSSDVSGAESGVTPAYLTMTNTGKDAVPAQGWALYFTCLAGVDTSAVRGNATVEQVVGTLYRLRPAAGLTPLEPGQSWRLPLLHPDDRVNAAKAPQGPFLVFDGAPDVARSIEDYQLVPGVSTSDTTAEAIYQRNAGVVPVRLEDLPPLLPTPQHYERHAGVLHWALPPTVTAPPALHAEAAAARTLLARHFPAGAAAAQGSGAGLRLQLLARGGTASPESYELDIDPVGGVRLAAPGAAGIARGLASLRQLLPQGSRLEPGVDLPALHVSDAPRFAYRGLMLDVARNFEPKSAVLRLLDLMARYKLNSFHFHLTDDEGWRLEIPGLPELTAVGARRGYAAQWTDRLPPAYGSGPLVADAYGSGHYTRADYLEILRYAAALHIEVIPEIEMPGHARAAVVAMAERARRLGAAGDRHAQQFLLGDSGDASVYSSAQQYHDNVMNPGLPSTYAFIAHVVRELAAMHREAGVPLRRLHVGGDELPAGAWLRSPACAALMKRAHLADRDALWDYFYARVERLLRREGIAAAGWEELGTRSVRSAAGVRMAPNPGFVGHGIDLYVWRNIEGAEDLAYRLANAGYDTVLAPATRLYLDQAYVPHGEEPGQDWASYAELDAVFDFVPLDDIRVAADNPAPVPGREALTAAGRAHIRGIEGTLFTETVRDPARLEYLVLPRLLALAERAWAPDPDWARQADRAQAERLHAAAWSTFVSQLGLRILPQLDAEPAPFLYRIPPPGLHRAGDAVLVNEQIPGFALRYSSDGIDPTAASRLVDGPIRDPGAVRVAAFDRNGRASRASRAGN